MLFIVIIIFQLFFIYFIFQLHHLYFCIDIKLFSSYHIIFIIIISCVDLHNTFIFHVY